MIYVCIIGATGLVGQMMLNELEALDLKINIDLYASVKSAGNEIQTSKGKYIVLELNDTIDFSKYDIAMFSAGKDVSLKYAKQFEKNSCYVIDNSSAFRMDEDKALLAMGVNLEKLNLYDSKIIANPNCSTIQSVITINQLSKEFTIKDVDYVTYQAVSGSGIQGINELKRTQEGLDPKDYKFPIANNLIPQIDIMLEDSYTFEEDKMIFETQKILNINTNITATCVRVPIVSGHTVQIRIEFDQDVDLDKVYDLLGKQKHLIVLKDKLPMPFYVRQKSHVEVGRIKKHKNKENILFLMCVADNIKVGAATNAIEIAKYIIKEKIWKDV